MKGLNTKYDLTKFADLSEEEFRANYFGYKKNNNVVSARSVSNIDYGKWNDRWKNSKTIFQDIPLPPKFDWRPKGAVTAVKDQGQCK